MRSEDHRWICSGLLFIQIKCRASLAITTGSRQSFRRDMPETAGNICLARRVGKGDRMKRSEIRENIFKLVFCGEFHTSSELEDQLNAYLEDVECTDQERSYIAAKFEGI